MAKSLIEKLKIESDNWSGCETTQWINPDIAPLPPSRRTWGLTTFLGFGSIAK